MQAKLTDFDEAKLPNFEKERLKQVCALLVIFVGIFIALNMIITAIRYSDFVALAASPIGLIAIYFGIQIYRNNNRRLEAFAHSFNKYSIPKLYRLVKGPKTEQALRLVMAYRSSELLTDELLQYRIIVSHPSAERETARQSLQKNGVALRELVSAILKKQQAGKELKNWLWLIFPCAVIGFVPGLYSLAPGKNILYLQPWFSKVVAGGAMFAMYGGLIVVGVVTHLKLRSEDQAIESAVEKFDLDGLGALLSRRELVGPVTRAVKHRKLQGDPGADVLFKRARKLQIRYRGF